MTPWNAIKIQNHPRIETADHLIPYSLGGRSTVKNMVAACNRCNQARKDNPLEIWLPRLELYLRQLGIPLQFQVILQRLKLRGIEPAIRSTQQWPRIIDAPSPLPTDASPAPQGQPEALPEG